MKKLIGAIVLCACMTSLQAAGTTKQDCLACHGPFDKLISKNIAVEADPKPVNPHTFQRCDACHGGSGQK